MMFGRPPQAPTAKKSSYKKIVNGWAKRRSSSRIHSSTAKNNNTLHPSASPTSCPAPTGKSVNSNGSSSENLKSLIAQPIASTKSSPRQVPHYVPKLLGVVVVLLLFNAILLASELPDQVSQFNPRMIHFRQKHPNNDGSALLSFENNGVGNMRQPKQSLQKSNQSTALSLSETATPEEIYVEKLQKMERLLSGQMNAQVRSCRFVNCSHEHNDNGKLVVYNPFPKPRSLLCNGQTLEPNGTFFLTENDPCLLNHEYSHTHEPYPWSKLYPVLPTRRNQQNANLSGAIPPIRLGIKGVEPSKSFWLPFKHCDVKCYQLNNNINLMAITRTVEGTEWEIVTSMEGPKYFSFLLNAPTDNVFYASTLMDSAIPMPYFSWDDYAPEAKVTVPGNNFDQVDKAAVFMARNCHSKNQREALVQNLTTLSSKQSSSSSALRVDSISRCLHNHEPPPTVHKDDKNEILNRYMFYLAFENQCAKDYITEKVWGALFRSGTIPIYYGAPNIREHVPPGSIINVDDFANVQALWAHLVQVANNQTLYESYHAWRQKPLPDSFLQRYNFTHTHSLCRMCRWAFSKQHGWAWNHDQQIVEDDMMATQRRLCWDKSTGLLTHPFRESWMSHAFQEIGVDSNYTMMCKGGTDCSITDKDQVCENDNGDPTTPHSVTLAKGMFRRTVWSHDGVLDLILEPTGEKRRGLILKAQIPLLSANDDHMEWNMINHRHFWVQSQSFRMTVVTNQDVSLASPIVGVMEVFIALPEAQQEKGSFVEEALRMRFIVEHIDEMTKRQDTNKSFMSYFGNLMAKDFMNPTEKFLVLRTKELIHHEDKLKAVGST